MKRFFLGLRGGSNIDDPFGLRFETELQAFHAAENLARELSEARPSLQGNTWIALTQEGSDSTYCIAVGSHPVGRPGTAAALMCASPMP
ncbi:MAG TPA: hypothetical protein VKR55_15995 [Bradyrhizobium sp.]|uniref:hypothetical protein n=1 Tax=Bradyrhizobium sp. TaxID=376 RepID=UPI002B5AE103|nr:hypothetical protein [Bradyrhizobium sp.]HLZ03637.1 hypothetical protein [Bradyrhizobium sp.]